MKKITKNTMLSEILEINPNATEILFDIGLHCIGCHGASMETLEQGCMVHGMDEEDIKAIVKKLNEK